MSISSSSNALVEDLLEPSGKAGLCASAVSGRKNNKTIEIRINLKNTFVVVKYFKSCDKFRQTTEVIVTNVTFCKRC